MKKTLTVFTPTYNREVLLENLYNYLCSEEYSDFEWLIIDDGSTDNTEIIVQKWIKDNIISIRYFKQENSGKHVAYNRAIKEADSLLFICIDSDDIYIPNALKELVGLWSVQSKQFDIAGLMYLSQSKQGELIGKSFPADEYLSDIISINYKYKVTGDKGILFELSKLKEYKFPIYEGEKFVTESALFGQFSKKYEIRSFRFANTKKEDYQTHTEK